MYRITVSGMPITSVMAEPAEKRFRSAVHEVAQLAPHTASPLEASRRNYQPDVPQLLVDGTSQAVVGPPTTCVANEKEIAERFPSLFGQPIIELRNAVFPTVGAVKPPLRIGCVLSGGQASGGHNCICGLYDYVMKHHPGSSVYGFIGGPKGVMTNTFKLLDAETVDANRNSGGFTMLASGRDKIETPEQFAKATHSATANALDGLVVIGGDDSNTNACLLAEHYMHLPCISPAPPLHLTCISVVSRQVPARRALQGAGPQDQGAMRARGARARAASSHVHVHPLTHVHVPRCLLSCACAWRARRSSACQRRSTATSRTATARPPSASTRPRSSTRSWWAT